MENLAIAMVGCVAFVFLGWVFWLAMRLRLNLPESKWRRNP